MKILIAGSGIGGLTAALSLHAAGLSDVTVLEAAREIREVGVGINLPPHAMRELTELGLDEAVARVGVPTAALAYHDRKGQPIWTEARGLDAGYRWPQYSVHRGYLQRLLVDAVRERLGEGAIRTGQRATRVTNSADGMATMHTQGADGSMLEWQADVVIAADGIRSSLRQSVLGAPTPLASHGWMMYRGTTQAPPFLGGRTMVICGDEHQRIVVYPIAEGESSLLNWLLVRPQAADAADDLGNWNVEVDPAVVAHWVDDWRFDWLDMRALVAGAPVAYEYPMADIDPLPTWVSGRCALLGDAAHAMYPFGSNGASQAILDARVLAYELATQPTVDVALAAYDAQRRLATAAVQLANRRQASDVMVRVSDMARHNAHGQAAAELQSIERDYKRLAGFDAESLNTRRSWSVTAKAQRA